MENIIPILIGGGLFAFLQFLISRYDAKHDKLKEVLNAVNGVRSEVDATKKEIDTLRAENNERQAILSRTHILRFRDELYNDQKHTSEYFEQTLDDIEVYEKYCDDYPEFSNGRTKAAAEFIREEYKRLFKEHKL